MLALWPIDMPEALLLWGQSANSRLAAELTGLV